MLNASETDIEDLLNDINELEKEMRFTLYEIQLPNKIQNLYRLWTFILVAYFLKYRLNKETTCGQELLLISIIGSGML